MIRIAQTKAYATPPLLVFPDEIENFSTFGEEGSTNNFSMIRIAQTKAYATPPLLVFPDEIENLPTFGE